MTHSYSVVSIEDDVGLFDLIDVTLRPLPVELHHASTGAEALNLIPQVEADVIILDISLPDIQGWEVLKQLHDVELPAIGVIVLTGRTNPAHRVMAHFQNVSKFLTKPFEPAELREAVRDMLDL